jgi:hypothetical protein
MVRPQKNGYLSVNHNIPGTQDRCSVTDVTARTFSISIPEYTRLSTTPVASVSWAALTATQT